MGPLVAALSLFMAACAVVWITGRMFVLWPLQLSDFVVNGEGELVLLSQFNEAIFVYSPQGGLVRSFRLTEGNGKPQLCVDSAGNLYVARRRSVEIYGSDGTPKGVFSTSLAAREDWRLTDSGQIEHMEPAEIGQPPPFTTDRLRRIARPGDILFYQSSRPLARLDDPFVDDGGINYHCASWFSGIRADDAQGQNPAELRPPFWLRPFLMPWPGGYAFIIGLPVLAGLHWLGKRSALP